MTNQWAFLKMYENCWLAGKMLSTNIKNIVSYSNSDDKVNFQLINEVGEPPNHKRHLGFTVVCLWNVQIQILNLPK